MANRLAVEGNLDSLTTQSDGSGVLTKRPIRSCRYSGLDTPRVLVLIVLLYFTFTFTGGRAVEGTLILIASNLRRTSAGISGYGATVIMGRNWIISYMKYSGILEVNKDAFNELSAIRGQA